MFHLKNKTKLDFTSFISHLPYIFIYLFQSNDGNKLCNVFLPSVFVQAATMATSRTISRNAPSPFFYGNPIRLFFKAAERQDDGNVTKKYSTTLSEEMFYSSPCRFAICIFIYLRGTFIYQWRNLQFKRRILWFKAFGTLHPIIIGWTPVQILQITKVYFNLNETNIFFYLFLSKINNGFGSEQFSKK